MLRPDLVLNARPLQAAGVPNSFLSMFKSLSASIPITTSIVKSMNEYRANGLDAIALLGEVFAKAEVSPFEPTGVALPPSVHAARVASQSSNINTPEHQLAAHRALAIHHLHSYHYAMSQKGPEAAAPFAAKHLAHQAEVETREGQGVQDTPQHHIDLYNHYASKLSGKSTTADPIKTDVPTYSLAGAHADHLIKLGHGTQVGEPEQPSAAKPSASPSRLYSGKTFVGDPKLQATIQQQKQTKPFAGLLHGAGMRVPPTSDVAPTPSTGSRQVAKQIPRVQDVASKPSGARPAGTMTTPFAQEPTVAVPAPAQSGATQNLRRAIEMLSSLYKSAADIQKDYGYGGAAEAEELAKPPTRTLPSLFPGYHQEQRVSKQQKTRRQKQTEEMLGVANKSLQLLNSML